VIELKEDDFRVVEAMLHFMYRFDYDGSGNDQGRVSPMLFNVQVYGIADKYGILALKSVAKEKFDKAVRTCWDMDDFAHVITEIYSSTPSTDRGLRDTVVDVALTDRGLRDTVVDVAHEHIRALLEKDDFRGVLEETAVLLRMSRNLWPKRQDLQLSESIDAQMVRISGKRCFLLRVRTIVFDVQNPVQIGIAIL